MIMPHVQYRSLPYSTHIILIARISSTVGLVKGSSPTSKPSLFPISRLHSVQFPSLSLRILCTAIASLPRLAQRTVQYRSTYPATKEPQPNNAANDCETLEPQHFFGSRCTSNADLPRGVDGEVRRTLAPRVAFVHITCMAVCYFCHPWNDRK